jgi:hypothetical protein
MFSVTSVINNTEAVKFSRKSKNMKMPTDKDRKIAELRNIYPAHVHHQNGETKTCDK